jgi:hypothetical protein
MVMWGEEGKPPRPVGTVPSVDWGKGWVQSEVNRATEKVQPLLEWTHYLSRGTSPGTAHYVTTPESLPGETFEVWALGEIH